MLVIYKNIIIILKYNRFLKTNTFTIDILVIDEEERKRLLNIIKNIIIVFK